MAPRTVFANLADGLAFWSLFDQSLADTGKLGITPCLASGINAIALTPLTAAFAPTVSAYLNYLQFSFVASSTSNSAVTINVSGIGAKNLYHSDGITQAGNGDIVSGSFYVVAFVSSLNSNNGGFVLGGGGSGGGALATQPGMVKLWPNSASQGSGPSNQAAVDGFGNVIAISPSLVNTTSGLAETETVASTIGWPMTVYEWGINSSGTQPQFLGLNTPWQLHPRGLAVMDFLSSTLQSTVTSGASYIFDSTENMRVYGVSSQFIGGSTGANSTVIAFRPTNPTPNDKLLTNSLIDLSLSAVVGTGGATQVSQVLFDPTNIGTVTISSGTYNNVTGLVTLTMSTSATFGVGTNITISGLTGTGGFAALAGTFTSLSVSGTTVTYNAGAGHGASTITGGSLYPSGFGFTQSRFYFQEINGNGSQYGVLVMEPVTNATISGGVTLFKHQILTFGSIHGQSTAGIQVGQTGTNASGLGGNIWTAFFNDTASTDSVNTYESSSIFYVSALPSVTSTNLIHFQTTAQNNIVFAMLKPSGSTFVRDENAAGSGGNIVIGQGDIKIAQQSVIVKSPSSISSGLDTIGSGTDGMLIRDAVSGWIGRVFSGDVTMSAAAGTTTIAANAVTNAKFRQGVARSVVGVTGNATANVADIQGTASQFLGVNSAGTALAFQTLAGDATLSGATITLGANVVTYAKFQQVAASSLVGNPTGSLANAQGITLGATLAFSGTALQTAAITGDVTASANSFTTTVAKINGATLGTTTASSGNILIGSGSQWVTQAVTGAVSITSGGVTALTSSGFANPTNPGVNLSGANGSATTAMRSDAVLVLDQTIAPTWTGQHIYSIARTIASATAAALDDVKVAATTTTITGNTGSPITRLAKVGLYQPTLTDASAVTVTDAATLYIDNAPLAAGSVTITNPWALLVGTGASKFQAMTVAGILSVTNSTASSSTSTGALVVTGGVGIGGAVNINGVVTVLSTFTSTGACGFGRAAVGTTYMAVAAASTGAISINIASSGGATPSSPVDGDMWYDGTNVKFRVGGTTKTFTLT